MQRPVLPVEALMLRGLPARKRKKLIDGMKGHLAQDIARDAFSRSVLLAVFASLFFAFDWRDDGVE
eukprot:11359998-Alexandrium_andersonii.AAC.1